MTRANEGRGAARTAERDELTAGWEERLEAMRRWLPDEHPPFAWIAYITLRSELRRVTADAEAKPTREQVVARLRRQGRDRVALDELLAELEAAGKRAPPAA